MKQSKTNTYEFTELEVKEFIAKAMKKKPPLTADNVALVWAGDQGLTATVTHTVELNDKL